MMYETLEVISHYKNVSKALKQKELKWSIFGKNMIYFDGICFLNT
jgi:hypothetical protein